MAFDQSEHFRKKAEHDRARSEWHMKSARLHKVHAEHHDATNPVQAQFHRDQADLHKSAAADHSKIQDHYESEREKLAAGSGATVIHNHESETRDMHSSAGDGDLKLMNLVVVMMVVNLWIFRKLQLHI